MTNPENNQVVTESLESILPLYPNCNTYIMDRNCKFEPSAKRNPSFR